MGNMPRIGPCWDGMGRDPHSGSRFTVRSSPGCWDGAGPSFGKEASGRMYTRPTILRPAVGADALGVNQLTILREAKVSE